MQAIASRIIKLAETAIGTAAQRCDPICKANTVRQAAQEVDVLLGDEERVGVGGLGRLEERDPLLVEQVLGASATT